MIGWLWLIIFLVKFGVIYGQLEGIRVRDPNKHATSSSAHFSSVLGWRLQKSALLENRR